MSTRWVVGAIFACRKCGQEWQDYRTAQDAARRHANETGHIVTGEVTYAVRYNEAVHPSTPEKDHA